MHENGAFAHTMRAGSDRAVLAEGDSLRYAAIVALGLAFVDQAEQRQILGGASAAELAQITARRAQSSNDPGAIALAAWAGAEAANIYAGSLFRYLNNLLASNAAIETVHCSWILLAALAARHLGETDALAASARNRLVGAQGANGLFPHYLPASFSGRLRAHIGCFADQVYPIQALARFSVAYRDQSALAAANACAARICKLQGIAGQWWWHYDTRNGSIVEGYPVYSVHQHAMAPMALLDLREAGGADHSDAVARGLGWLEEHPEVSVPLVSHENNVIWRKAARREPKKAVRAISAMTTALRPGLLLPGLDAIFPPCEVDYECRPYELGWLLYAWLSGGALTKLRDRPRT